MTYKTLFSPSDSTEPWVLHEQGAGCAAGERPGRGVPCAGRSCHCPPPGGASALSAERWSPAWGPCWDSPGLTPATPCLHSASTKHTKRSSASALVPSFVPVQGRVPQGGGWAAVWVPRCLASAGGPRRYATILGSKCDCWQNCYYYRKKCGSWFCFKNAYLRYLWNVWMASR